MEACSTAAETGLTPESVYPASCASHSDSSLSHSAAHEVFRKASLSSIPEAA